MQHLLDGGFHHRRDVVGNLVLDVGREELRQFLHLGFDGARGRQRVAGRRHQHRQAGGRLAVQPRGELITHAADLDAGDIAQSHRRAVGIGAQHDAAEFIRRAKLALHQHQRRNFLVLIARLGADAAGRDLRVLRVDRLGDVIGGEIESDQLLGIDPHAQRLFSGIQRGAADAGDAADFAEHVADHEVAERDFIHAAVGGGERDNLQHRAGGFLDQDALLQHRARQPRLDALDAVLHVHRRHLDVSAGLKERGDFHLAQRVAGGFETQDAARAVEFFLDQPRDAGVEVLRRRARIAGRHRDRWRRDDRILRNREERDRDRADQTDEQRNDPGEDRPIDKERRHQRLNREPMPASP